MKCVEKEARSALTASACLTPSEELHAGKAGTVPLLGLRSLGRHGLNNNDLGRCHLFLGD